MLNRKADPFDKLKARAASAEFMPRAAPAKALRTSPTKSDKLEKFAISWNRRGRGTVGRG
jgi:hypothetical protein